MVGRLGDVKRIQSRLIEYESKAQEMSVGVNYTALDSERQRQEDLLRELRELEEELSSPLLKKTQLPQLASSVGVDLDLNTKCLKYLTDISELERYVADVAAQFAERSVELSNPRAVNSAVYTYKTLTDNVESCWDYVNQLASLVQIHLQSAAQYHQFFHEANELESKMDRQVIIAENRQVLNPARRVYKETSKLANEIREQLDVMRSLWDRSKTLVDRSSHILPMRLRLGGVAKGMTIGTRTERPVMVRAMTGLIGPNYSIQQGEHLRLIDNREDVRYWKVQTSTGIAKVPSVCFWLTGNDIEATNRAIAIKKKCWAIWHEILERDRKRLYENFLVIMTQLASEEHLYCTNYDALNDLLQDMRILIPNSGLNDGRLQAAIGKFQRKVIVKNARDRVPTSGLVLQEADLVRMRAPLLRLQDYLEGIRKMESEMKIIDERIVEYLSEVDSEREQVYNSIELLESLMEKSQTQLKDIMDELGQWRRDSPVQEVRTKYIGAPKTKHRLEYHPELAEAPQSPLGRLRSRSQPDKAQGLPRVQHKSRNTTRDNDYRRTHSAVSKMDAITQIGSQSKSAETQYHSQQDLIAWLRTPKGESGLRQTNAEKRSKSTQRSLNGPAQLSVMTQIGCESKEFGNQVDTVTFRTLGAEPNAYISPENAKLQHAIPASSKYVNCASQRCFSDAKSRTAVQQVNSCTQQGIVKRDHASSPTRDPSGDCPLCHQPTNRTTGRIGRYAGGRYYDTADAMYSGTEMQAMSEFYQISEEPLVPSSDVLVCKRVQVGYPSLYPKGNLYTQIDIYKNAEDVQVGDAAGVEGTVGMQALHKPNMNSYAQITVNPIYESSEAVTQVGVMQINRASNPHRQLSPTRMASESYLMEHSSMLSADVEELATQSGKRTIRAQAGYPTLTTQRSASTMIFRNSMEPIAEFAQVGSVYSQSAIQTSPTPQVLIQPESQPLFHAPVRSHGQLYADIHESSIQVGAMMTHERLSPIITELSAESKWTQVGQPFQPKMHSWLQCSVIAADKSSLNDVVEVQTETVNKKFQTVMPAFDSEVQVGRLYSSNASQTLEVQAAPEAVVQPIATMEYESAMRELPEVAWTEAQAAPVYHGKKLQVSVEPALCELATEPAQGHNKKVQVALELRREHYDVSCDAVLKPDTFSKKIQVENLEPPVMVPTRQEPVFAPAPSPAPSMQEAGCECKPVMRESSCLAKSGPLIYDASVQITPIPTPVEKTHGKKLQVDLIVSPEPTPIISTQVQTAHPSVQDFAADPCPGKECFDAGIQISAPEPDSVRAEAAPVVHSAPPAPTVEYADTGCDVISGPELNDAFVQADQVPEVKAPMFGKKLQVSMTQLHIDGCQTKVRSCVEAAVQSDQVHVSGKKLQVSLMQKMEGVENSAQTTPPGYSSMGVQMDPPEPMLMPEEAPVVHAAPPLPAIETEDRACDAIPMVSSYDAFAQVEPEMKAPAVGKKLQVRPPPLDTSTCQTDMVAEPPKPQLVFTGSQCMMPKPSSIGIQIEPLEKPLEPVTPQPTFLKHLAPPEPLVETEDAACDPVPRKAGYDVFIQAEPEKTPQHAKKLQVVPRAPEIATCQTLVERVPYEIVRTQCVAPPKPENFGKKLQVQLISLDTSSCQTELVLKIEKPVLSKECAQCAKAKLASFGIQTEMLEPVQEVVPVQPTHIVHAAPPVAETEDRACDAIAKTKTSETFIQIDPPAMVQSSAQSKTAPKTQLNNKDCQTDAEEPPVEVVATKAAPVIHSAPPVAEREDRSCDAIEREKGVEVFTQSDPIRGPVMVDDGVAALPMETKPTTFGKKLQVHTTVLATTQSQSDIVQPLPKPMLVSTRTQCIAKQMHALGVQVESEPPPVEVVAEKVAPVVHSAPPVAQTEDRSCDAIERGKVSNMFTQSDPVRGSVMIDDGVAALPIESKPITFGKKMQVEMSNLTVVGCQTHFVFEAPKPNITLSSAQCQPKKVTSLGIQTEQPEEPPAMIAPTVVTVQKSAPPMAETEDRSCDAIEREKGLEVFTQSDPIRGPVMSDDGVDALPVETKPVTFGKKFQVNTSVFAIGQAQSDIVQSVPKPMLFSTKAQCISKQMNTFGIQVESDPPPVEVVATKAAPVVHSAPPVFQNDMWVQAELPAKRPPCRGVRIQAGLPITAPKVQMPMRDGYVQSTPVVMVGTTQTIDQEETPVIKVVEQTIVKAAPPAKPIPDDNIFSFTRETVARVTRSSSRKSSGLIPYKTQVFFSPKQMSASMPAGLNARVGEGNVTTTTTTTERVTYQQVPTYSHLPRRYATRLRSPSTRQFYTRRNMSAENVNGYETYVNPGMCRNYVSEHALFTIGTCVPCIPHACFQQCGVEQRCGDTLEAYVRQLGYERVHRTLVEVARALKLEELEATSCPCHTCSHRSRPQDARSQYTSTTSLVNVYPGYYSLSAFSERYYKSDKSVQEGNSFVRWTTLAPGERISIVRQSELSLAEENFLCFGEEGADSSRKELIGWVRKTRPLTKNQPEAVRPIQETSKDAFLKSRALSAYCSDAELQESGIKTNYSAYDAFTLVYWQANDRGDGRLDLSAPGRLLMLTLVGARLPGSGEVIAAADAFYRGILRIVYFDEESSTMLSLPAAINTGHVIVEKQYPPGVGIALRGDQDRYPVESEVVWSTPELRHRSYKVNYIRKSETEKIDVLTALDEGVIDQYSGEIVKITLGPSTSIGESIHEARESSVGSGDTVIRRQKPERFSINEAILNDILNVEFDGQETIVRVDLTKEGTEGASYPKSGSAEPSEVDI